MVRGQCACRPTALVQMNARGENLRSWMVYHTSLIYPPATNSNATCPEGRTCLDATPKSHSSGAATGWDVFGTTMDNLQAGRPFKAPSPVWRQVQALSMRVGSGSRAASGITCGFIWTKTYLMARWASH